MYKFRWFYTYKSTFKGILFIVALLIIMAQVWYTQWLVQKLRDDQREIIKMNANMYSLVGQSGEESDLTILLEKVIKQIRIPVILTSPDGEPLAHKISRVGSPFVSPFSEERKIQLRKIIATMDKESTPIPILYDSLAINYIHYGDSEMIHLLSWIPAIQVSIVGLFIFLGFIGFNSIRRSEQRYIWVGMAKETAHQLGTPISSLIGWLELLKEPNNAEKLPKIVDEIERDAIRFTKVAQRFSQIGTEAELKKQDIVPVLKDVVNYFQRRLPQYGKSVVIEELYPDRMDCFINKDLFEWAVENLIKNAIDAIEGETGRVIIQLSENQNGKQYYVDITDSGKGMTKSQRRHIFKPGYTTKPRGWGLGLSLVKRIIEDYHRGKLLVKFSKQNEGTTMRIFLPREV